MRQSVLETAQCFCEWRQTLAQRAERWKYWRVLFKSTLLRGSCGGGGVQEGVQFTRVHGFTSVTMVTAGSVDS